MPPQGRYQQPPYGGPGGPPMGPQSGYMWQHGQYGNPPPPPPPHSWGHGSPPPPGAMYPQRGGPSMTPDRYSGAYRGPAPMQGPGGARRSGKAGSSSRPPSSKPPEGAPSGPPLDGPPPPGYQGGWGHPQGSHFPQQQWGSGPPPGWQGSGPGMHQGPGYGGPGMYSSANSPSRGGPSRPRASPEMMGSYSGAPVICQPADNPDMDMYVSSRSVGPPHDDDGTGSTSGGTNGNSKDKGRGSYKCGRVSHISFIVQRNCTSELFD